jgi:hypothetical protein
MRQGLTALAVPRSTAAPVGRVTSKATKTTDTGLRQAVGGPSLTVIGSNPTICDTEWAK